MPCCNCTDNIWCFVDTHGHLILCSVMEGVQQTCIRLIPGVVRLTYEARLGHLDLYRKLRKSY